MSDTPPQLVIDIVRQNAWEQVKNFRRLQHDLKVRKQEMETTAALVLEQGAALEKLADYLQAHCPDSKCIYRVEFGLSQDGYYKDGVFIPISAEDA